MFCIVKPVLSCNQDGQLFLFLCSGNKNAENIENLQTEDPEDTGDVTEEPPQELGVYSEGNSLK